MQRTIIEHIQTNLGNRDVWFVFPTGVVADFWGVETARVVRKPVNTERFAAWDTFKSITLSAQRNMLYDEPINNAIRTLFASNFLLENRKEKFLSEYIPPKFADSYHSFISNLVKLLPALDGVIKKSESSDAGDAYWADMRLIHKKYARFLEEHQLYEPSWNRAPFDSNGKIWFLFFPELSEDWEEYAEELTALSAPIETPFLSGVQGVRIVSVTDLAPASTEPVEWIKFRSTTDEFRRLALTCRKLLADGVCPEDIAVSLAGTVDAERLAHEFRRYGLTADVRKGRNLPKHPGGRIFAALSACKAKHWSFQALKDLLLDKAFPWKDKESIDLLMEFGIRFHCMSGFYENGIEIDVWEKTFMQKRNMEFGGRYVESIWRFYRRLKEDIRAVLETKKFSALIQAWAVFERNHFDKENMNSETANVIGKSIASLQKLVEIEEKYEKKFPQFYTNYAGAAFPIFQAYIKEEPYVFQSKERGILVYAYKVAAGIFPRYHFIANMNQDDAAVVYDGRASFLREDRKKQLNVQDRDVSEEFIRAYAFSGWKTVFSVADRTFSNPATPHRKLSELFGKAVAQKDLPPLPDPYEDESAVCGIASTHRGAYPSPVQRRGWAAFKVLTHDLRGVDLRRAPIKHPGLISMAARSLRTQKRFSPKRRGMDEEAVVERLSPTDVEEFIDCPFAWVLRRGLNIREKQTAIETLDQRDMGNLYHRILERFFTRIKNDYRVFHSLDLPNYKKLLNEEIDASIDEAQNKEGYFQKPVFDMLRPRIQAALEWYLESDAETLDGCKIIDAEHPLRKDYADGRILSGIADLVLEKDGYILTDFKTGSMPELKDLFAQDAQFPKSVQIAAYITMLETAKGEAPLTVRGARFYSIDNREFRDVVSEDRPRSAYDKEVHAVDDVTALVWDAMERGDYRAPEYKPRHACSACSVLSVCRKLFL
ncbi:MAG: PD-(D/E)XK nuclease family protein [Treponema sp.]|jgi:RecB family exonuclease|nr:PD-(D/E)XK nuclease family protein [Treponema sp.]